MPSTITTTQVAAGQAGAFVLNTDASRLYVAGFDGVLRIFDAASGALLTSLTLGGNLQGIDISPDGSFLLVTNSTAETVDDITVSTVFRVEIASLTTSSYTIQTSGTFPPGGLFDVVITAGNRAMVTMGGVATFNTVYTIDLGTGLATATGSLYGGDLTISSDNSRVLGGEIGISTFQYQAYNALGEYQGQNSYVSGVFGSPPAVEALSPSGNHIAIVGLTFGERYLQLYDGNFNHIASLTGLHSQLAQISGLAFSTDGSVLCALSNLSDTIYGIRMSDLTIVETIALPAGNYYDSSLYGQELVLTSDDGSFFVRNDAGVLRVDRTNVNSGTSGDDTFAGVLYRDEYSGLGGNDTITGDRGNDRLDGGAGNDTINGGLGDDELIGGDDNDQLNGGSGSDVAVFAGDRADYLIDTSVTGQVTITGIGTRAASGTDVLTGIEQARFDDMTVNLVTSANTPPVLGGVAIADQTVGDGTVYTYQVPAGAFIDADPNDPLAFRATLQDGSALPEWLAFNPATRTFTGTPPASAIGATFVVRVYAADQGTEISDTFALSITMSNGPDIVGTNDYDLLEGTARPENFFALDGDDDILGSGGADTIDGGAGDDGVFYFFSQSGVTVDLAAGLGTRGDAAGDIFISIESLGGSDFDDVLLGSGGSETFYNSAGADIIDGQGGDDTVIISNRNINFGFPSTDGADYVSVTGGAGTDTLVIGGPVNLGGTLSGFEAIRFLPEVLPGGPGVSRNPAVLIVNGEQFASGFASNTVLSGTGSIVVNMSANVVFFATQFSLGVGASVSFEVHGTTGIDMIKSALTMANTIFGEDGVDQIRGGNLADAIDGGADNDKIMGLGGADLLTGGTGSDQFRYLFAADSGIGSAADQILDFTNGQDKLDFRTLDADPALAGRQALSFIGTAAFATDGSAQLRYVDVGADTRVEVDLNGDGTADMQILLVGHAGQALSGTDLLL